jgi:hypothetical protein
MSGHSSQYAVFSHSRKFGLLSLLQNCFFPAMATLAGGAQTPQQQQDSVEAYILALINPATREAALLELSKKRESYADLAPSLWFSGGVIACLLQEVSHNSTLPCSFLPSYAAVKWLLALADSLVGTALWGCCLCHGRCTSSAHHDLSHALAQIIVIYPMLSPPSLTAHASNRVCNALALLQCVASHPDTRPQFMQGALR